MRVGVFTLFAPESSHFPISSPSWANRACTLMRQGYLTKEASLINSIHDNFTKSSHGSSKEKAHLLRGT